MRIAHINSVVGFGSTGKIVLQIHNELISNGHESIIFYGRRKQKMIDKSYYISGNISFGFHYIVSRLFDRHGRIYSLNTKKMIKMMDRFKPDIIHIHNLHGYYLNYSTLFEYIKVKSVKVVWTLHDCWSFTGHCSHFEYVKCDKWKTQCHKCPQLQEYPKSLLLDQSDNNFHTKKRSFSNVKNLTICVPSEWLKNQVKLSFLKEYPVVKINNGIDTNIFKKRINSSFIKNNNMEKKFIILAVASKWTKKKGFNEILELSKLLTEDEIILLVGIDRKIIKKLPNNIVGIAKIDSAVKLSEIYSNANVFINPTLEDTFPTVNIEAQACGTFVITYDSGGSAETIHKNNGVVVRDRNIKSLYEEVQKYKKSTNIKVSIERNEIDKMFFIRQYYNLYSNLYMDK